MYTCQVDGHSDQTLKGSLKKTNDWFRGQEVMNQIGKSNGVYT